MLLFLQLFACEEGSKTFMYDISSTILVTDERGLQVDMEDIEFCQRFQSEDFDTRTSWSVHAEQCETVDIDDGVAILSNWEGEYFGPDVSIVVEMKKDDDVFFATLIDNDQEVWCDNQVVTSVDEHNDTVTYSDLCSENYERYLLWSLVVPVDTF